MIGRAEVGRPGADGGGAEGVVEACGGDGGGSAEVVDGASRSTQTRGASRSRVHVFNAFFFKDTITQGLGMHNGGSVCIGKELSSGVGSIGPVRGLGGHATENHQGT